VLDAGLKHETMIDRFEQSAKGVNSRTCAAPRSRGASTQVALAHLSRRAPRHLVSE
jgi:hypothetical protein